ncbi:hypothetical protein KEM48_004990 [Puccinia striiformis f. sp. tritici PST-130]|nr:hypothetical protein KEM48_004990 [Puccinia striiformis f. sp. tritici PST-130]
MQLAGGPLMVYLKITKQEAADSKNNNKEPEAKAKVLQFNPTLVLETAIQELLSSFPSAYLTDSEGLNQVLTQSNSQACLFSNQSNQ